MRSHRALVSVVVLLACAPKSAETAETGTSTGETDDAGVTSATDTTPTTGAGPTTTPMTTPTTTPPTTAGSDEGSATSLSTGTSTDTGDETGGGLPGACAAVCMHFEACAPGSVGPVDECAANCVDGFEVPSACAMATAEQWSCVAGLSCEEALKFLDGPGDGPTSCLEELKVADATCEDIGCGGEIGGGDDFCELEQQCGDDGAQNFHCDVEANLCTCTENDVPGAQCPADGFCRKDRDEQIAAITACCGWEWKI